MLWQPGGTPPGRTVRRLPNYSSADDNGLGCPSFPKPSTNQRPIRQHVTFFMKIGAKIGTKAQLASPISRWGIKCGCSITPQKSGTRRQLSLKFDTEEGRILSLTRTDSYMCVVGDFFDLMIAIIPAMSSSELSIPAHSALFLASIRRSQPSRPHRPITSLFQPLHKTHPHLINLTLCSQSSHHLNLPVTLVEEGTLIRAST